MRTIMGLMLERMNNIRSAHKDINRKNINRVLAVIVIKLFSLVARMARQKFILALSAIYRREVTGRGLHSFFLRVWKFFRGLTV